MSKRGGKSVILANSYVLFVCEGTAEEVIINKLNAASVFDIKPGNLIDITRIRAAKKIEEEFFNVDYDLPVQVIRILDSRSENFKKGKLYEDRYSVVNVYTRPEIEMLVVHNEDKYEAWNKSGRKPCDFCADTLGLSQVKSREFLDKYWDVESIKRAAETYKRKHKGAVGEFCLRDLWE